MNVRTLEFATTLVFCLGATAAHGETLQTCAAKQPDSDRLACFDQLALDAVPSQRVETEIESQWVASVRVSPLDDSKNVYLHLTGSDGIRNQYGQASNIVLTLACRENVTSAYVSFGGHFMSDLNGAGRVTYRVDAKTAQTQRFDVSNDNEALGLWSGGASIPWIKSLFGGSRMYLEATPYSSNSVSDFFAIAGLEEAIIPLREACDW